MRSGAKRDHFGNGTFLSRWSHSKQNGASNGEMVVALLEDSATVKTFYREDGFYRLQPENDYMEPIIVEGDLQILGKVIGVLRFMS